MNDLKKNFLLNIGITNEFNKDILKYILYTLEKTREKYYVVTPNPEILMYANSHPEFKTILNNARLGLADGIGVIWAGKILGVPFKERFAGVDFVESVCKEVNEKPITVGFLGGKDSVAERTAECLLAKYPGLKVVFAASQWPSKLPKSLMLLKMPMILFVAFGFPKQEIWMAENLEKIPVRIAVGVGGSFDYISGKIPRAPLIIRNLGFEWFYRLIVQPWRIKRQIELLKFILLVFKEKIHPQNIK